MKISCQFDTTARRLVIEPEDKLERTFLEELTETCSKGTHMVIRLIDNGEADPSTFNLEMRINGFEKERQV